MIDNQQRIVKMKELLTTKLKADQLEVIDESHKHAGHPGAQSGAGHFYIKISSPLFREQSLLHCHRMIYEALAEMMKNDIHALRIKLVKN